MSQSKTRQVTTGECPITVSETVCIQTKVTIKPSVEVGDMESFCVGGPKIGACAGTPVEQCTFTVSQSICVQIPLAFSAAASAAAIGIVCGMPGVGGCIA